MPTQRTARPRTGKLPAGIRERHARLCATEAGGKRCSCTPSYEAVVSLGQRGQRKRKTFPTLELAKNWRSRISAEKQRHRLQSPSITLREAAEEFIEGMREGASVPRRGSAFTNGDGCRARCRTRSHLPLEPAP